jgi:hypothetical protein
MKTDGQNPVTARPFSHICPIFQGFFLLFANCSVVSCLLVGGVVAGADLVVARLALYSCILVF